MSVHHGGGVGIGNSIHAGLVIVADGSDEMDERLTRVLTNDPGIGVARHADAGYPEAIDAARAGGIDLPMEDSRGRPDGGADGRDRRVGAGGPRPLPRRGLERRRDPPRGGRAGDLPAGRGRCGPTCPTRMPVAVVDAAVERFGGVDALAHIAGGFAAAGTIDEQPVDVWRSQMAINLDTAYS